MTTFRGTKRDDTLIDRGPFDGPEYPTDDNTFQGFAGNDKIYVYQGNDTVYGGSGNDLIELREGEELSVFQQFGTYGPVLTERSATYSDTVDAGSGNDTVLLGTGTNTVDGGKGYDILGFGLVGGGIQHSTRYQYEITADKSAKLIVDLAAGTVSYAGIDSSITLYYFETPGVPSSRVDIGPFSATGLGAMNHAISNFEAVRGNPRGADILRGSDRTDVVEVFTPGKAGAMGDALSNDRVDGRGGIDIVDYAREAYAVELDLSAKRAEGVEVTVGGVVFGGFTDTLIGIEGAFGTKLDDVLTGDANDNFFYGGKGADVLTGGAGFDIVTYTLGRLGTVDGGGIADL
ncbi:MAG: hypothetical protein KDK89_07560, partial [Alphaproteobacteria bacterium]|nr:hypothetical protein [Alphaproteobacteria bacterium]